MTCEWGLTMTVRYREHDPDEPWKGEDRQYDERVTYCSHPGLTGGESNEAVEIEGMVIRCQGYKQYEPLPEAPRRKKRKRRARRDA